MKSITTKCFALGALLLFGFNISVFADSTATEKIEIVDEIKIQAATPSKKSNPALKQGEACDDEKLEPAQLSPDNYVDVPMAETLPCDDVDCSNLPAAKLHKDTFKKLPMAQTEKLVPCHK